MKQQVTNHSTDAQNNYMLPLRMPIIKQRQEYLRQRMKIVIQHIVFQLLNKTPIPFDQFPYTVLRMP
ncbi:MAG TPA: hypothetical protein DEP18_04820 [Flavobacteriales bacterium]|nr:hypothetical protein [Flavobacteriales bacterium]HCA83087.1 hypothetical protein [Flavobacteriales bacterium]